MPRNLRFEVHKVLRLLRNLHFQVDKVLRLPRNLDSQSAAPATKSALQDTLRRPARAFCRKSASKDNIKIPKCSFRARLPPMSENDPHVQKSRFTAPVTKLERVEDHHEVQSAAPATRSAYRSNTAPIRCTCHEKSTLDHQNTRLPLPLPRKVTSFSKASVFTNVNGKASQPKSHSVQTRSYPLWNQLFEVWRLKAFKEVWKLKAFKEDGLK